MKRRACALVALTAMGCGAEGALDGQDLDQFAVSASDLQNAPTVPLAKHRWLIEVQGKCTGALVDPKWVLTSADCCTSAKVVKSASGASAPVVRAIRYPGYEPTSFQLGIPAPHVPLWRAKNLCLLELGVPYVIRTDVGIQTVPLLRSAERPTSPSYTLASLDALGRVTEGRVKPFSCDWMFSYTPTSEAAQDYSACMGGATSRGERIGMCSARDDGSPLLAWKWGTPTNLVGLGTRSSPLGVECALESVYQPVDVDWVYGLIPGRGRFRIENQGTTVAASEMALRCAATGEERSAPMDLDGAEVSIHCPSGSTVTATCSLTPSSRSLTTMARTLSGVTSTISGSSTRRSETISTNQGGGVQPVKWTCGIGD